MRQRRGRLKSIMYRWALEALTEMEERMLRIASYYVAKEHDSQKDLEGATECDFSVILEDLWESECWFVEGKLKIMQALREGYEHATDRAEQSKLAVAMLELIDQVPQYDLTDRSCGCPGCPHPRPRKDARDPRPCG